jgi:hypothetical protein
MAKLLCILAICPYFAAIVCPLGKKNVSSHLFTSEVAAASSRSAAVLRSSSEHKLSSWPALRGAWPTPKCSKHKTLGVCFSDLWCKLYDMANVLCMPAWWESTQSSNPKIQTQTKNIKDKQK